MQGCKFLQLPKWNCLGANQALIQQSISDFKPEHMPVAQLATGVGSLNQSHKAEIFTKYVDNITPYKLWDSWMHWYCNYNTNIDRGTNQPADRKSVV